MTWFVLSYYLAGMFMLIPLSSKREREKELERERDRKTDLELNPLNVPLVLRIRRTGRER